MHVTPFQPEVLPQAADLFVRNFKALRREMPLLPDTLEHPDEVLPRLMELFSACPGAFAFEADRLVGYLGWYVIDQFRGTDRRAAYCPEWAHAAEPGMKPAVYRALYRAASARMAAAGCQAHAVTLLARDPVVETSWFWNGFGLAVVDALRPIEPPAPPALNEFTLRKASPEDANRLAMLEIEHWQHYTEPPVFMAPQTPMDAAAFAALVSEPKNAVWLALDAGQPAGFIRFEGGSFGAADVVNDEGTVAITGAFVRPAYRGRRAALALLCAALQDFSRQGYARCSVDFESFNPEAANFWMRYFEPVCLSVMRVPERI
ncbi:MAG TPA: GNAT family N-acetyltransferase [Anaerolineaceae bacterium]|nr:GNAT family N-acetyltransferase [Anaerolineaceae bacterium]